QQVQPGPDERGALGRSDLGRDDDRVCLVQGPGGHAVAQVFLTCFPSAAAAISRSQSKSCPCQTPGATLYPSMACSDHLRRDFSLDNLICQCSNILVLDVEVIQSPQAAAAALDPVRTRLLAELSEPASAATLAARLSLPRQKVNYHLRALESHCLVRPTSERKWGGITERLVEATASSYVVSPAAMGPAA